MNIESEDVKPQSAMTPLMICLMCDHLVAAVLDNSDHRCGYDAHLDPDPASASYPTVEWMRSASGPCGPDARCLELLDRVRPTHQGQDPSADRAPPELEPMPTGYRSPIGRRA